MKLSIRAFAAGALLLVLGTWARATMLVAGPVQIGPGEALVCRFTNVSPRPLKHVMEALNQKGNLLQSYENDVGLQPFVTAGLGTSDPQAMLCRFTFSGSARLARASAIVVGPTTQVRAIVPAQ